MSDVSVLLLKPAMGCHKWQNSTFSTAWNYIHYLVNNITKLSAQYYTTSFQTFQEHQYELLSSVVKQNMKWRCQFYYNYRKYLFNVNVKKEKQEHTMSLRENTSFSFSCFSFSSETLLRERDLYLHLWRKKILMILTNQIHQY